jgi:hypothetical protein
MDRRRLLGLAGLLAGLTGAGLVAAQPVPPTAPAPPAAPQPAAAEEAPPANVVAPPPVAAPAVPASEVAPAAPPKAQVVEKPAESVLKRPRYDIAILQALDKVTAETVRFEAAVGQPVRYKTLVFTVKACEQAAEDEPQEDSIAYLTVESQPKPVSGRPTPPPRQVFKGWMYASSPGLHPLQHPVYDAWLITCRATAPAPGAAPASRPAAPRPSAGPKAAAPSAPAPSPAPPTAAAPEAVAPRR